MNLEQKFIEIIERKHRELNLGEDYSQKFSKIRDFEGNAIGQNIHKERNYFIIQGDYKRQLVQMNPEI